MKQKAHAFNPSFFMVKNAQLAKLVERAQKDFDVYPMIERQATGILTHLGVKEQVARAWLQNNIKDRSIET